MATEKEFLSAYRQEDYERPSVTADIAAFMVRSEESESYRRNSENTLALLLIRRGEHPFKDHWALPGGFLRKGETVEECAFREIKEETSVTPASLMPVGVFSAPDRDPRGWIISNAFVSVICEAALANAASDASDAKWFDVHFDRTENGEYRLSLSCGDIRLDAVLTRTDSKFGKAAYSVIDSGSLAFDHACIIAAALTALREGAKRFDTIFGFLPERFTLNELQRVQETVLNISVLPANFRRKVADYVEETDEYTKGHGHRPAKLYTKRRET